LSRILRETVAEQSTAQLRRRILSGELRPGTPLVEDAIADELGVSRSTIRQALNTLMLEGVLMRHPATRVLQVTLLSRSDVRDIYRARCFLELGGVEAAAHASPEALARIEAAVDALADAVRNDDAPIFVEADFRCHSEIVALLGSKHLSAAHVQLMVKLRLAIIQTHTESYDYEDYEKGLAEHRKFCRLLLSGAIDEARENLATRLAAAEEAVCGMAMAD